MPSAVGRAVAILRAARRRFVTDHALRSAAALSYYAVFSVVPLLFLVAAVAGFVFDDPDAAQAAVSEVSRVAGTEVGDVFESLLATVRAQRGGALSIGLVLAAVLASGVLQQAQSVLGEIFRVPPARRRPGLRGWMVRRGIAVGSSLGISLLVLTPIAAAAAADSLARLLPDGLAWLGSVLRLGVPISSALMLMAVVGLTFQVLTPVKVPWKAAVRGGAATALLASASAFLVGVFLSRAGSSGTLGALGGVAILLLFFFMMWGVYLFGAEITKVYADYLQQGGVTAPSDRALSAGAAPNGSAAIALSPGAPRRRARTPLLFVGIAIGWLAGRRASSTKGRPR